jgi:hypothetical protein
MDPNAALKRLKELLAEPLNDKDASELRLLLREVGEQFEALDEWLVKGGFPPSDWDPDPMPGGPRR